jgi:glyoxylase-like metal-dependent hydrolase (beta-lactamase superfamily II)
VTATGNRRTRRAAVGVLALWGVLGVAAAARAQGTPPVSLAISPLAGNVYVMRSGPDVTVFQVTDKSIVVVDPLSLPVAQRLKEELLERFADRPVRYVLHTSHRFNRASGASVFNETAELAAHEFYPGYASRARQALEPFLARLDADRDGRLTAREVGRTRVADAVMSKDRDGDGSITPDELYRNVREPEAVFARSRRLEVDGQAVTIVHAPLTEDRDASVVLFPAERLAFASVVPEIAGPPAPVGANSVRDLERWYAALRDLPFDRLFTGDGAEFTHDQLAAIAADLEQLNRSAAAAVLAGQSLVQAQASLGGTLPGDAKRVRDEQLASAYRSLRLLTTSFYGVTGVRVMSDNSSACEKYTTCETGATLGGGGAGLRVMFGRAGVDGSLSFGQQYTTMRDAPLYGETVARRDTVAMALFRFELTPSVALAGGASIIRRDAVGVSVVRAVGWATSGRAPLDTRVTWTGFTFGGDYSLGPGRRVSVPVRATYVGVEETGPVDRGAWQLDVGVSVAVLRRRRVF